MIYYLMGKSASGKDSIYHRLLEGGRFQRLVPYTTRPMREGEEEGREYHFLKEESFLHYVSMGKMAEYRAYDTIFGKWYYGTMLPEAEGRSLGTCSASYSGKPYRAIGTLESFLQLKKKLGKDGITPIYLEVPDAVRLERAYHRQEGSGKKTKEEILRRFKADDADFSEEKLRQAGVHKRYQNANLEDCLLEIEEDIEHERTETG